MLYTMACSTRSDDYILQAFVIYRGCHYISVCSEFDREKERFVWVLYNDGNRMAFCDNEDMITQCMQFKGVPVLLLFSKVLFGVPLRTGESRFDGGATSGPTH